MRLRAKSTPLKMAGVKVRRASASLKKLTHHESFSKALEATEATETGARITAKME
jgi:hypothetical protein